MHAAIAALLNSLNRLQAKRPPPNALQRASTLRCRRAVSRGGHFGTRRLP
jgi:hypothetical protein